MCLKPFKKEGMLEHGCGQCNPCRINRIRLWVGRMYLEAMEHPASSFVTLTYNEEHMPKDGCVTKKAVQLFLKRLRDLLPNQPIRYYAVGEYGDKSWRPHYHLIIFGLFPSQEQIVAKCWPFGFVSVGTAEPASMSYCASYIQKKLTKKTDPRLTGRTPEFCLMSLKPGIGAGVVERLKKAYSTEAGKASFDAVGWIVNRFKLEGMSYPLGTYLTNKLVEALGLTKEERGRFRRSVVEKIYKENYHKTVTEMAQARAIKISQQRRIMKGKTL